LEGRKISGSTRFVMIRVFEGALGSISGGRSERLRDSGDLEPDDALERDGDGISVGCMCMEYVEVLRNVEW
jgi:hypothetical protein